MLAWAVACTTADDPTTGPPPVVDRCADARPGDLCLIGNIPEDLDAGMGAMVGLTDRRIAFGGDAQGLMSADGTTAELGSRYPADNVWEGVAPAPDQLNYFTAGATAGGGEAFFANTWGLVAVDLTTAVHRFVVPPDYKVHAIRGDGTLSERVALPGGGYRSLIYDSGGFDYGGSTSVWHLLPDHRTVVDLVGVTDEYAYAPDPAPIASTPIGLGADLSLRPAPDATC